jgi:hypothetical protein
MDALLVTGARAPHLQSIYNTHKMMNKVMNSLPKFVLLAIVNVKIIEEDYTFGCGWSF